MRQEMQHPGVAGMAGKHGEVPHAEMVQRAGGMQARLLNFASSFLLKAC